MLAFSLIAISSLQASSVLLAGSNSCPTCAIQMHQAQKMSRAVLLGKDQGHTGGSANK